MLAGRAEGKPSVSVGEGSQSELNSLRDRERLVHLPPSPSPEISAIPGYQSRFTAVHSPLASQ